ncbi:MAG: hypothetical protein HKN26_03710 [Acidimicrobiales bacterium]|nr:hypothetical protein [Acidimicrobiales bacterium]
MAYDPQKNKRRPRPPAASAESPVDGLLGDAGPEAAAPAASASSTGTPLREVRDPSLHPQPRLTGSSVAPSVTPGPGAPDPSARLIAFSAACGALSVIVAYLGLRRWRGRR